MGEKQRYPYAAARVVAAWLEDCLGPFCEKVQIAGSLRRRRAYVGDIEVLFIPKMLPDPESLFASLTGSGQTEMVDMAERCLNLMVRDGTLSKRKNSRGSFVWGEQNKLAIDNATGIPVDFFATTAENWFMSLVIRTGGKQTNIALATTARARGLKLNPYGAGFTELATGRIIPCLSEHDVFRFAGASFLKPEHRP